MADGLIYIPPSKNVGESVHDINDNFEYLDKKTPSGSAAFTEEMKQKLEGIEENANNYSLKEYVASVNKDYEILLSDNAESDVIAERLNKSSGLTFNPYTKELKAGGKKMALDEDVAALSEQVESLELDKVYQEESTLNADFPLLASWTVREDSETNHVQKSAKTTVNPYTGEIKAVKFSGTADNSLNLTPCKTFGSANMNGKYVKLATWKLTSAWESLHCRYCLPDMHTGYETFEFVIDAQLGADTSDWAFTPKLQAVSGTRSIGNLKLNYNNGVIQLWWYCQTNNYSRPCFYCIYDNMTPMFETALVGQTSMPTTGVNVSGTRFVDGNLPLSGGTISNAEYAGALKINRTSSSGGMVLSVIDYLLNGDRIGVIGFDYNSMMRVRNSDNIDMLNVSSDGALKTASSGKLLYSSSTSSASPTTISITDLFTKYSAALCNVTTSSDKYSLVLPLQYIKSLGTSSFYEAEDLLFYYVNDGSMTIRTGLGQSNPTINSVKIINLL